MGMFGRLAQTGRAQLYPDQFAPGIAALQPVIASPQAPDVDPSMLATAKPAAPARRGMFGSGFLSWFTPERLQIIGAGMRQAGGVNGALDQELERQVQATAAASQQAWQKQVQGRQLSQWDQADEQRRNEDAWVASLPASQQPLARANPTAALTATIEANAPPNAYQRGELALGQARAAEDARHNRATEASAAAVQNSLDNQTTDFLAQQYLTTGSLPTGLSRNTRIAAAVYQRAQELAGQRNMSAADVATQGAAYRANSHSLSQLRTQRTAILRAEDAAQRNINLAEQTTERLARTGSPLINGWLLQGRNLAGDPDVAAANISINRALDEYARVITGAYGAGGTPVTQMEEARRMLSTANTPEQIRRAFGIIRQEMSNVRASFDNQEQELMGTMRGTPTPDNSGEPAPTPQAPGRGRVRTFNPQTGRLE